MYGECAICVRGARAGGARVLGSGGEVPMAVSAEGAEIRFAMEGLGEANHPS